MISKLEVEHVVRHAQELVDAHERRNQDHKWATLSEEVAMQSLLADLKSLYRPVKAKT